MSDQFGMPEIDNRPAHEVITELRQRLLELRGMREEVLHYQREFHNTRDQLAESENLRAGIEMGMDCANAEAVRLRQQVTLLRDALLEISQVACSLSPEQKIANKALIATDQKIQQSRSFTDPVTDDDFLHMIDESNFAQEGE